MERILHMRRHSYPKSRYSKLSLLPALLLFLFGALAAVVADDEANEGDWGGIEVQAVDNDDIEVKVAQGSGRGIVWGKSNKVTELEGAAAEDAAEDPRPAAPAPQPTRTTVQRPAAPETPKTPARLPALSEANEDAVSKDKYLLKSSRHAGSTDLVETLLEVTGDVKVLNEAQETVKDKMEVVAGFRYEERVDRFSLSSAPLVSVRQYNLAKAKMKIGNNTRNPELNEELQTIVSQLDRDKVSLFSPAGLLRGEELLLIEDLPGNTLTLDRLLPNREVAMGEGWKISDGVLRSFLSLEVIEENTMEAVLTAVADNMAMVEVVGDVSGIYLGAPTQMTVRAKFQFDLAQKRINWLGMLIEEDRSIGHVGPGFDLVARLQVKISPLDKPQTLTDEAMEEIDLRKTDKAMKLKYDGGKGPWRFDHDRDWYVYQDESSSTILRKLHQGELVAQCNIADMGKIDLKSMTDLDRFQQELIQGLGKNFGEVVAAEQSTNRFGYKEFTVILDGVVEDLPLRWLYTLLTDKNGQQAVVVFVVEARMLDQFADSDRALLETFRIGK